MNSTKHRRSKRTRTCFYNVQPPRKQSQGVKRDFMQQGCKQCDITLQMGVQSTKTSCKRRINTKNTHSNRDTENTKWEKQWTKTIKLHFVRRPDNNSDVLQYYDVHPTGREIDKGTSLNCVVWCRTVQMQKKLSHHPTLYQTVLLSAINAGYWERRHNKTDKNNTKLLLVENTKCRIWKFSGHEDHSNCPEYRNDEHDINTQRYKYSLEYQS